MPQPSSTTSLPATSPSICTSALGHVEDPPGDLVGRPVALGARRRTRRPPSPTPPGCAAACSVRSSGIARSPPSATCRAHSVSSARPVGRLGPLGRLHLDQRLDPEAVLAEEPDPLAVGQVELGRLVRARRRSGACRSTAASSRGCVRSRPSLQQHIDERRRVREREQPARPQQPRRLRHRPVRVAERHRAVVAEDDVEARVRQRHLLGGRVDEREVDAAPRPSARARARAAAPSCRARRPARRAARAGSTTAPRRSRARARPCPATSPRIPSSESGSCHMPQRGSSFRPMNSAFRAWYSSLIAVPGRAVELSGQTSSSPR